MLRLHKDEHQLQTQRDSSSGSVAKATLVALVRNDKNAEQKTAQTSAVFCFSGSGMSLMFCFREFDD
jgi:hypothetical protein